MPISAVFEAAVLAILLVGCKMGVLQSEWMPT